MGLRRCTRRWYQCAGGRAARRALSMRARPRWADAPRRAPPKLTPATAHAPHMAPRPSVARQTTYWALPALEDVVVTGAADAEALEALWKVHGSQMRVLEAQLGTGAGGVRGHGALLPMVDVGKVVSACRASERGGL